MPAFSYTQPVFGPEDEEREQADLTYEEREAILDDLHGRLLETVVNGGDESYNAYDAADEHDITTADDDVSSHLMEQFMNEMDKIPFKDKAEYLQALATNEKLFERECNPVRFLRYTNYCAESAATRMTSYWKMRLKVFGKERAFLPMVLGDDGALNGVIDEWKTKVPDLLYFLPNDNKGRTVVFMTRKYIQNPHTLSTNLITRVVWYVLHLALERESTQRNGIIWITNIKLTSLSQFDRLQVKLTTKSVTECVPVKIAAIHLIPTGIVAKHVIPVVKLFLSKRTRTRCRVYESDSTASALVGQLSSFGLNKAGLPKSIGGTYQYNPNWMQERLEFEQDNNW